MPNIQSASKLQQQPYSQIGTFPDFPTGVFVGGTGTTDLGGNDGTLVGITTGVKEEICTEIGGGDGRTVAISTGANVGERTGVGAGLVQFGGCIGTQIAVVVVVVLVLEVAVIAKRELIRVHTAPGSQHSELPPH